jgi:hypothetical protein
VYGLQQDGIAPRGLRVDVGAVPDQQSHHLRIRMEGRLLQGRIAPTIADVGVGTLIEQTLDSGVIPFPDRSDEGRIEFATVSPARRRSRRRPPSPDHGQADGQNSPGPEPARFRPHRRPSALW